MLKNEKCQKNKENLNKMDQLLNQYIIDLEINPDYTKLRFKLLDNQYVYFYTYGDCCSHSWFSEIGDIVNIIDTTVMDVLELNLPIQNHENGEGEDIKYYGYRLATQKGHCVIAFRNASNGYYGGSCNYSKQKLSGPWASLKDLPDWTAEDNAYLKFYKLRPFI